MHHQSKASTKPICLTRSQFFKLMLYWVASILAGIHLRVKSSAFTEKAPSSAQMELVRIEISVQMACCNQCPDPSCGDKVNICPRCAQVDDLLMKTKMNSQ